LKLLFKNDAQKLEALYRCLKRQLLQVEMER